MSLLTHLRHRPRLLIAFALGLSVAVWPLQLGGGARALVGWNLGVWTYLALVGHLMFTADATLLQRKAREHADGRAVMLLVAVAGAAASLAAIMLELGPSTGSPSELAGNSKLALALLTVTGSWLLLPLEFSLAYASLFHQRKGGLHGLEFPGDASSPDYGDFLYFAVTVAATSQTSDVAVSSRPMRRLVLLHALLSFIFNTSVLALLINILAGLVR